MQLISALRISVDRATKTKVVPMIHGCMNCFVCGQLGHFTTDFVKKVVVLNFIRAQAQSNYRIKQEKSLRYLVTTFEHGHGVSLDGEGDYQSPLPLWLPAVRRSCLECPLTYGFVCSFSVSIYVVKYRIAV